jgi:hypothetical protein
MRRTSTTGRQWEKNNSHDRCRGRRRVVTRDQPYSVAVSEAMWRHSAVRLGMWRRGYLAVSLRAGATKEVEVAGVDLDLDFAVSKCEAFD